jgi:hypothetical protein
MNYCALDDAFQVIGAPSPGCANDTATRAARKEERRKARRCKGPQETYFDKDPDRQNISKLPIIPAMNPSIGLREHTPVDAPQGSLEPFVPRNDDDVSGDCVRNQLPCNIPGTTERQKSCTSASWFGADIDESFADYIPESQNYRLQPDFLKAFEQAGVARAGSTLPNPSTNMYWKPFTTSGAQTSFIDKLPPPGGEYTPDDIMKKLDRLWARLDDMNRSTPEQVTSELLMFISSGIFVLFMMDLLVKKGSTMRF